jgi:pyridoxine 5-phosphate synthase
VNLNKIALLRNARGQGQPDVLAFARMTLDAGAFGITVHPRPDQRHCRFDDVHQLKKFVTVERRAELNVEGYPSEEFLRLIDEVKPAQVTLVPDPPSALTSNAGWNVKAQLSDINRALARLNNPLVRTSVFIDPYAISLEELNALKELGVDRIELYTQRYAEAYGTDSQAEVLAKYRRVAELARDIDLGVNAGHDLNQDNLGQLVAHIPWLDEVSIGHALVCEALVQGWSTTISNYTAILSRASGAI